MVLLHDVIDEKNPTNLSEVKGKVEDFYSSAKIFQVKHFAGKNVRGWSTETFEEKFGEIFQRMRETGMEKEDLKKEKSREEFLAMIIDLIEPIRTPITDRLRKMT